MELLRALRSRRSPPPSAHMTPVRTRIAASYCDAFNCASTRTGFDPTALGGATLSSGVPIPRERKRWKRMITVPVRKRYNVSATSWDDFSGEGSISYSMQPHRKRKSRRFSVQLAKHQFANTATGFSYNRDEALAITDLPSLANTTAIRALRWGLPDRRTRALVVSKGRAVQKRTKPSQVFRIDFKRDQANDTLSFQREEAKLGKVNLTLTPKKRIAGAAVAKGMLLKKLLTTKDNRKRPKARGRQSNFSSASFCLKSDFEYKWKDNSLSIVGAVEAYNASISLRSRLRPHRLSSRIQIPLSINSDAPWICWVHEPRSGWGEWQIGRKGLELSVDWQQTRLGVKKKDVNGNLTRIAVNKKGAIVIDKTVTTGPLIAGSVGSISAHLSNQKGDNSLSASFVSPFGVASVSASAARSLNILLDFNMKTKRTLYAVVLKIEPKRAAARFAVSF